MVGAIALFDYADNSNIYIRSEPAGHPVMESLTRFITTRSSSKSMSRRVRWRDRRNERFWDSASPPVRRSSARLRRRPWTGSKQGSRVTRRAKGVSIETTIAELAPYMRGWRSYFGFCETPEALVHLTRWVRLRLRAALWRQWKTPAVDGRLCWHWGSSAAGQQYRR